MKKANSGDRGSAAKSNVAPKGVDEYLAGVPEPARTTLNTVRAAIRSAVPPEATEAISYRIPTFKYKGPLLGFAAFSNHCSLFPMSLSVMEAFKNELKDLPGIGDVMAQKIIDGRPYRSKRDLLTRKIIPASAYNSISNRIVASQPKRK